MSDLIERARHMQWLTDYWAIQGAPTIEYPHGLIVPLPMPIRGCCFCIFRDGNLCRFLPDDVEVVEAAKLEKRHELCPLVEV